MTDAVASGLPAIILGGVLLIGIAWNAMVGHVDRDHAERRRRHDDDAARLTAAQARRRYRRDP